MKNLLIIGALLLSGAVSATAQDGTEPVLTNGRFEQIAVTVSDLDRAERFYEELVGLRLMFRANEMLFFDVGGVRLMVALDLERRAPVRPTSIAYFHVKDFVAARTRLVARDAALVGPVETVQSSVEGDLRLQQFQDPDGNMLAIMGFVPS